MISRIVETLAPKNRTNHPCLQRGKSR